MHRLFDYVERSGFPHGRDLVHLFVGGSELHGAKLGGTDDLDIYGLFVEPPDRALGLEPLEHFVWSTGGDERRNTADDVDVTLYSLRKWARFAVKGNPTALHFLFASNALNDPTWSRIVSQRDAFLARSCAPQFVNFADAQLKRMTGERGRGKKGQRPEIEARFGYDTKSAMHTLRLLYECLELMQHGTITLPRPEREFLVRVRAGEFSLDKILDFAKQLFARCEAAEKSSPLPLVIDRDRISQLISRAHLDHWNAPGTASNAADTLLPATDSSSPHSYILRGPQPGDLGWVVQRHGALYTQEYGWDWRFEAYVARIAADFVDHFDPQRERCWIAERNGNDHNADGVDAEKLGCVFLVNHPPEPNTAKLRMLLVEPSARGLGLGKRLVDECTRFARDAGYSKMVLFTCSVLHTARHIYEQAGYRKTHEEPDPLFKPGELSEKWELDL